MFEQQIENTQFSAYLRLLEGVKRADILRQYDISIKALNNQRGAFIEAVYSAHRSWFDEFAKDAKGRYSQYKTENGLDAAIKKAVFSARYPDLVVSDHSIVFDKTLVERFESLLSSIDTFPYKVSELADKSGIEIHVLTTLLQMSDQKLIYGPRYLYCRYTRKRNLLLAVDAVAKSSEQTAQEIYRSLSNYLYEFRQKYPTLEVFLEAVKRSGAQMRDKNPLSSFGHSAIGYEPVNSLIRHYGIDKTDKIIDVARDIILDDEQVTTTKLLLKKLLERGIYFPDDPIFLKTFLLARSDLFEGGMKQNIKLKAEGRFKTLQEHISEAFYVSGKHALTLGEVYTYLIENVNSELKRANTATVLANKFRRVKGEKGFVYLNEVRA